MNEPNVQVSIILSLFNESQNAYLPKILTELKLLDESHFEVLAVDGGSSDHTQTRVKEAGVKVFELAQSTRAARFNFGLKHAKGSLILFHHPRIFLDKNALNQLLSIASCKVWGGFTHIFDLKHPMLHLTSAYSNFRVDRTGIVYLDHGLFSHKSLLRENGAFFDIDIFEDTEICSYLRRHSKPIRFQNTALVSSIRFARTGILRQLLLNQIMKVGWHLRISPKKLNQIYEKGLQLNS